MIKTTPRQIMESQVAISALLGSKLPVKAAYSVSKLAKACEVELNDYNNARAKIFNEAGCTIKKDAGEEIVNGEKVKVSKYDHVNPAILANCVKEGDELGTAEVQINALPLDLELFGNAELQGSAFYGLEWAMKDPS